MQDRKEDTPFAKAMALSTIARTVWTQNSRPANSLLEYSQLCTDHIIVKDKEATIQNSKNFNTAYHKAKSDLIKHRQPEMIGPNRVLKKTNPRLNYKLCQNIGFLWARN